MRMMELRLKMLNSHTPMLSELWKTITKFPDANWEDALSNGQVSSKEWLVQHFLNVFSGQKFQCVFVLAGWYGILSRLLLEHTPHDMIANLRSFDSDIQCQDIADSINRSWVINDWKFKAATLDIQKINYQFCEYYVENNQKEMNHMVETPDLIINTSCEHIANFDSWFNAIPKGMPVILQSNNAFSEESHINCVSSLDEFMLSAPVEKVLYAGEKKFSKYSRYMIIGIR